jgi:hypothetical protein
MSKTSLSATTRKQAVADDVAARQGVAISTIGEMIGNYSTSTEFDKADLVANISSVLVAAMKDDDLQAEDLKAPSNSNPGELWTVLVDSINAPRLANELPELATGTRDNYLSRIRAFLRARGAEPLDLFGNFAVKKAKAEAAAAQQAKEAVDKAKDSSEESGEVADKNAVVNAKGPVALRDFLAAFIVQNDYKKANNRMQHLIDMADDLLEEAKKAVAAG